MWYTVWILAALLLLLLGLARWKGIYPHRPLLLFVLVPTVLAVGVIFLPDIWPGVVAIDLVLFAVAMLDLLSFASSGRLSVERKLGVIASIAQPHAVTLTIANRTGRDRPVWVRDGVVEGFEAEPAEFCVVLPAEKRATLDYQLRPHRRGGFDLESVHVRLRSGWGLWNRFLELPCHSHVKVYPDMKQLAEYALLARTNRLSLMGLRRTRRLGQDNEFERLRDYTLDDNYRHIEWRSTARRNKLTVKDLQANQSQRIVFLIDCGRMMTGTSGKMSLLDHAFNAMLMLSYVALARNDQVGLICFSNGVQKYVPAKGGKGQMNRLLHAVYDQFPQMVESRYDEAFLHLASHVRKRALVVLITNVVDEVNAHQIQQHLTIQTGRHLPLAVLLRDHAIYKAIDAIEPELAAAETAALRPLDLLQQVGTPQIDTTLEGIDDQRLYRAAAAADILTWRQHVLADLEMNGVLLVDAFPEQVTGQLVNRYLEAKARHLL